MADKALTESAWKAFSKGKNYKDSAFVKSLSELAKAEKEPAEKQIEALEEVEKQADALRRANKADRDLGGYIDDVEKSLGKAKKDAQKLAKEQAEAAEAEEEEDTPVLLTSKMIPLLRQIRKGEPMFTMVAAAGKATAVLIMRKPVSPARKKLLAEFLGNPSGLKAVKGECGPSPDGKSVIFDLESTGGTNAKRIRQALLEQTGLRVSVKMSAPDAAPEDLEDGEQIDLDDDFVDDGGAKQAERNTDDALKRRYDQRSDALEPRVLDALRAKGPDVSKIRAVSMFAGEKAEKGEYAAALKALDQLELLLGNAGKPGGTQAPATATPTTAADPGDTTVDPASSFKARLAALMPKVQQAIAAEMPDAVKVKNMVASAGGAAQRKEFGVANAMLDEVEEVLAKATGAGQSGVQLAQQWDDRVDGVEQMLQRVLRVDPTEGAKAAAVMKLARGRADAGEHAKALAALDQVAKMIAAIDAKNTPQQANQGGYKGIVAYRTSLIEFRNAVNTVGTQIENLRKAIPSALPDEEDMASELSATLKQFTQAMLKAVDDAMNASENEDSPITRALAARIAEFDEEVASNELIQHVDNNPFGVKVAVGELLGKALKNVRKNMPAPV
jgi:hypothetical protein